MNVRNEQGTTPVLVAHGSRQITNLLLAMGAEVNAVQKQGETPGYLAALNNHDGIVIATFLPALYAIVYMYST